jgi:hypothetical protein
MFASDTLIGAVQVSTSSVTSFEVSTTVDLVDTARSLCADSQLPNLRHFTFEIVTTKNSKQDISQDILSNIRPGQSNHLIQFTIFLARDMTSPRMTDDEVVHVTKMLEYVCSPPNLQREVWLQREYDAPFVQMSLM